MTPSALTNLPVHRNSLSTSGISGTVIGGSGVGGGTTQSLIDERIGPTTLSSSSLISDDIIILQKPIVMSSFIPWSVSFFACPSKYNDETRIDLNSKEFIERKCRFKRNEMLRQEAKGKLFINNNNYLLL